MDRLGNRRELTVEFVLFGGSVVLLQASRFVLSLVVAHVIFLDQFAFWALFLAVLAYAPSLLFGVLNGMGRELPYLLGAGRIEEARAVEGVVSWTVAGVMGVVLLGSGVALGLGVTALAASLVGVAVVLAYQSQQFAMRASLKFNRASAQQGLLGALFLCASGVLLVLGHTSLTIAVGAYGTALMAAVVGGLALHPPHFQFVTWPIWRRVQAVGFPIMLAGAVFSVFVTSDRWIATSLLGSARAGSYGLASVVGSAMLVVPSVISQQTYPRMAIAFGREGAACPVFAMARMQNRIALLGASPLGFLLVVSLWLLVPEFLPRYEAALLPATLLVIGFVTMAAFTGYGNFLNVVGQQWAYLRAQLLSATVGVGLMAGGALALGPFGISLGAAVSYGLYGFLVSVAARRGLDRLERLSLQTPGSGT